MPLLYMLDTNTVSYFLSGRSPYIRQHFFKALREARIALSVLTEAELRFGLEKKPHSARVRRDVEDFLMGQTILPWNSDVVRTRAQLRHTLQITGKSLGTMDLLIAAHAIAAGATLVTHDRAFQHLPPWLAVEDWATDL